MYPAYRWCLAIVYECIALCTQTIVQFVQRHSAQQAHSPSPVLLTAALVQCSGSSVTICLESTVVVDTPSSE